MLISMTLKNRFYDSVRVIFLTILSIKGFFLSVVE